MAEGHIDGRSLTGQCIEILNKLGGRLPELAGKADGEEILAWQEKIKTLLTDVEAIKGKLFLKTKEGTELAEHALKKVKALEEVEGSVLGMSEADAIRTVETAVEEMAAALSVLSEKARAQVIRMT